MKKELIEKVLKSRRKFFTIFYTGVLDNTILQMYVEKPNIRIVRNSICVRSPYSDHEQLIDMANVYSIFANKVDGHANLEFGSDPELFFEKNGVMIPSTQIMSADEQLVTRDGFQVELHPYQSHCRQLAGNAIKQCLIRAKEIADRVDATLSFNLSYTVDSKVWKVTGNETKQFGCHPTLNVHEQKNTRSSGLREKFRAGGGHIHVGKLTTKEKKDLPTLVKIMDIVVGNTLVLLDRDEANITRRKNYGRAGEYRAKPYGLEYRVPSNFWLKHYILWSLASGLIRNAVVIYRAGLAKKLIASFDMEDIRNAINNNDYGLAMQNYLKYMAFLDIVRLPFSSGLDPRNNSRFLRWVRMSNPLRKLGAMDNESIYRRWERLSGVGDAGFERFINTIRI